MLHFRSLIHCSLCPSISKVQLKSLRWTLIFWLRINAAKLREFSLFKFFYFLPLHCQDLLSVLRTIIPRDEITGAWSIFVSYYGSPETDGVSILPRWIPLIYQESFLLLTKMRSLVILDVEITHQVAVPCPESLPSHIFLCVTKINFFSGLGSSLPFFFHRENSKIRLGNPHQWCFDRRDLQLLAVFDLSGAHYRFFNRKYMANASLMQDGFFN